MDAVTELIATVAVEILGEVAHIGTARGEMGGSVFLNTSFVRNEILQKLNVKGPTCNYNHVEFSLI
jgi:hypothetical protein